MTAQLVASQVIADGVYPNAAAVFAESPVAPTATGNGLATHDFDPAQPRDPDGRWSGGGVEASVPPETVRTAARTGGPQPARPPGATGGIPGLLNMLSPIGTALAQEIDPEEESRGSAEPAEPAELQPGEAVRLQHLNAAREALKELDPQNQAFEFLRPPGEVPTEAEIESLERATREVVAARACSPLIPTGRPPSGAQPGISGTSTTLQSIDVPIDLTLNARGETINQRANDYAEEARTALSFYPAPYKNDLGDKSPDGLETDSETGLEIALEVKYLSNSGRALRDPGRDISFNNQKDLDQARKYINEYKGELLWVTNNKELADKYSRLFEANKLSGFRVVFIPSKQE